MFSYFKRIPVYREYDCSYCCLSRERCTFYFFCHYYIILRVCRRPIDSEIYVHETSNTDSPITLEETATIAYTHTHTAVAATAAIIDFP